MESIKGIFNSALSRVHFEGKLGPDSVLAVTKKLSETINSSSATAREKKAFFLGVSLTTLLFIWPKWHKKLSIYMNVMFLALNGLEFLFGTDRISLKDSNSVEIEVLRKEHSSLPIGFRKDVKSIELVEISSTVGHKIQIQVITPHNVREMGPIIVYIHGGGFVVGNPVMYEPITTRIANETRSVVVSLDYRKAPESKFPDGPLDCIEATQWVYYNAHKLGGGSGCDNSKLVVLGDSAGGNLAAIVTQELKNMISLSIPIYPVVSFGVMSASKVENAMAPILTATVMDWYSLRYFNSANEQRHPLANPLVRDLSGTPRTHIITADCDVLRDEGVALYQALFRAGVEVSYKNYLNTVHGFFGAVLLPHGTEALTDVIGLIAAHFRLVR